MILKKKKNGKVFVEQRTYYIYDNEEDYENDKWSVSTSSKEKFEKILKNYI